MPHHNRGQSYEGEIGSLRPWSTPKHRQGALTPHAAQRPLGVGCSYFRSGSGPLFLRFSTLLWIGIRRSRRNRLLTGKKKRNVMNTPSNADVDQSKSVAVIITHTIKVGEAKRYEAWLTDMLSAVSRAPGYLGREIFRPAQGSRTYTSILRFDSYDHLNAWVESVRANHCSAGSATC